MATPGELPGEHIPHPKLFEMKYSSPALIAVDRNFVTYLFNINTFKSSFQCDYFVFPVVVAIVNKTILLS